MAMENSSMCEKTRIDLVVKKLKKSLLQDTLENSPFDMEVFGSKTSGDKHLEVYEKLAQKLI